MVRKSLAEQVEILRLDPNGIKCVPCKKGLWIWKSGWWLQCYREWAVVFRGLYFHSADWNS